MIESTAFIRGTEGDFLIAPFRKNANSPVRKIVERQTAFKFLEKLDDIIKIKRFRERPNL